MNFLYNGVKLPAFPEWDKEAYPYAYLTTIWTSHLAYQLIVTKEPLVCARPTDDSSFIGYISAAGGNIDCKSFEVVGNLTFMGEWEDYHLTQVSYQTTHEPFWANTDMEQYLYESEDGIYTYTATGEIVLSASEPIPVNPINPSVLLSAFFTGQAIGRMRGVQTEKTIVGYLYGGVGPLPELPQVEGLDYLWLVDAAEMQMGYMAIIANIAPTFDGDTVCAIGCKYAYYTTDGTAWEVVEEGDKTGTDDGVGTAISIAPTVWTSHDILNADGSTYLAASEPVAVYE